MRFPLILAAMVALASPIAMAGSPAKCTCTKKCQIECKAGHPKSCKCKHCDCAKGGKCDSGCSNEDKA